MLYYLGIIFFSYNICIRQEQGACCIKYSLCEDTYSFAIMNLEQSVATGANQGTYCDADHIEITGLKKECGGSNQGADRICGGAFNVEAGNTVSASSLCGKSLVMTNYLFPSVQVFVFALHKNS